jgi:hypothetical protein
MSIIKESFVLSASNTDILSAPSRLAALPGNGVMSIEASTTDSDASNYGTLTLQLPDGEVPFEDLVVPANGYSTADSVLHDDTAIQVQVEVAQGGHVTLSFAETGTVALTYITVTLEF